MLDIRRAIEFITEDQKAQSKFLIGSLLLAVPFANFAAVGYEVEVARRVARNEPRPLPEWNDLSGLFATGARLLLARLVYVLPMIAFGVIIWIAMFAVFLQLSSSGQQQARDPGPMFIIVAVCLIGVVIVYGLLFSFFNMAILAVYAQRGTLAACFDFAAIARFIRRNPAEYALAWLAEWGIGLIIGLILAVVVVPISLIPCLGAIAIALIAGLIGFFSLMLQSHLAGQLMRADTNLVIAKES